MTTSIDVDIEECYRLTSTLLEKATELITTKNYDELLEGLCTSLVEASPHILLAWIWFGPASTQEIIPQIAIGPAQEYAKDLKISRDWITQKGPVFQVLSGADLIKINISEESAYEPWRKAANHYGFQAAVAMRLCWPDAEQPGVIVLYLDAQDYFDKIGEAPFLAFARSAQSILHQCSLVERLSKEASIDPLTGLTNRRIFFAELKKHCIRTSPNDRFLAVGLLDLDKLKFINDRFGHKAGDIVLQETAKKVSSLLRNGDTYARLGGDEFGLIITDLSCTEDIKILSERILSIMKEPIIVGDDLKIECSASLGWAFYTSERESPELLIQYADIALYAAKANGRDQYRLHSFAIDEVMQQKDAQRALLEQALKENQLVLHYQPIVSRSGAVTSVEAILRIQHPSMGLLMPTSFFSALNYLPLARAVGRFVLDKAFAQAVLWREMDLQLLMKINISSNHLLDSHFLEDLRNALAKYPTLPSEQIEIEVAESASLIDMEAAKKVLAACRGWGLRIGLDDFGAGNASLSYIQKIPADTINIDPNIVRNMVEDSRNLAVVAGTIIASRMLGLDIVAEGVDSCDTVHLLLQMGCNYFQGDYFSSALTAAEIPIWATQRRPAIPEQGDREMMDVLPLILTSQTLRTQNLLKILRSQNSFSAHSMNVDAESYSSLDQWLRVEGSIRFGGWPQFSHLLVRNERIRELVRLARFLLDIGDKEGAIHQGELLVRENTEMISELKAMMSSSF